MFLNTLNESNDRLTRLLSLIDWRHEYLISNIRKIHRAAVVEAIESKQLRRLNDDEAFLYYMPKEECRNFKIR